MRPFVASAQVLVAGVLLGPFGYFTAFFAAYAFRDTIGVWEHVVFLFLIAVFAVVLGTLGSVFPTRLNHLPYLWRAGFGIRVSLALNALAVGIGSIVSAANKDQGSVSADFSPITDVLVAAGLFAAAVFFAFRARHYQQRIQASTWPPLQGAVGTAR